MFQWGIVFLLITPIFYIHESGGFIATFMDVTPILLMAFIVFFVVAAMAQVFRWKPTPMA